MINLIQNAHFQLVFIEGERKIYFYFFYGNRIYRDSMLLNYQDFDDTLRFRKFYL